MNEGIHYSAFISYKHAPADIAVASEIQKRLERYHIPGAIRKKTGKDKIGRIFRDKEELPITSDLSDDISRALEDADFLIVICSSSTKLSTWVPREIDYFLQFHERKRVLTVLVDGEPADVIPERLLKDTVVRTAPDGTRYEEEIPCEPLSCDFRNGIKAARREEIPRLAAALLGCTYDELVMRERQYKRRRRMAIGVPAVIAMIVAIGYLSWSRQEIKANLQQAQINQSEFLCNRARELSEDGDRIRAIQLVMEALPSEEVDRPLSRGALNNLVQVLHAYSPKGSADRNRAVDTCASFETQGRIKDFKTRDDGKYFFALDENGMLYVWDSRSYEKVLEMGPRTDEKTVGKVMDAAFIEDEALVLYTADGISAFSLPEGNEIWKYTEPSVDWELSGMVRASGSPEIIAALVSERTETGEDGKAALVYDADMIALDGGTGTLKARSSVLKSAKAQVSAALVDAAADASGAAVSLLSEADDLQKVYVWDKKKDQVQAAAIKKDLVNVQAFGHTDDGRLIVLAWPAGGEEKHVSGINELITTTSSREIQVSCLSGSGEKCLWETVFYSPQIHRLNAGNGLTILNRSDKAACQYANKTVILNLSDGSLYDEAECTANMVNVRKKEDETIFMSLENGMISFYDQDYKGIVRSQTFFDYDISGMAWINPETEEEKSRYLVQPDAFTLWLIDDVYDDQFTAFEGDAIPAGSTSLQCALTDHRAFYMSQQNDIYIYDLDSEAIKSRVTLEKKQMGYIFIGTDALRDIFWLYEEGTDDDPDYLVGVDAEGNVRRIRLRPAISKSEFMLSTFLFFDRLNAWGETHTVIAGLFDGTVGRPLPVLLPDGRMMWREGRSLKIGHAEDESLAAETTVDTDYLFERCYLSKDEKKALLIDPGLTALLNAAEDEETTGEEMNALLQSPLNPVMVLVDTTDGTQTLLQNTFYSEPVLGVFSENSRRVAVTDGQKAVIYDEEGKPVAHLSENGHEVINISAYKDELLVLYSEGLLARYDWQSGAGTGRSRVSYYHSSSDQLIEQGHFSRLVSWNYTDGKLYLQSLGSGDLLQVIDLGSWEEELASAMIKAYDPVRDRMIAMDNDEQTGDRHLGWFPHYTVEDLRRKALEALHGEELSDEERKLFGLD